MSLFVSELHIIGFQGNHLLLSTIAIVTFPQISDVSHLHSTVEEPINIHAVTESQIQTDSHKILHFSAKWIQEGLHNYVKASLHY